MTLAEQLNRLRQCRLLRHLDRHPRTRRRPNARSSPACGQQKMGHRRLGRRPGLAATWAGPQLRTLVPATRWRPLRAWPALAKPGGTGLLLCITFIAS